MKRQKLGDVLGIDIKSEYGWDVSFMRFIYRCKLCGKLTKLKYLHLLREHNINTLDVDDYFDIYKVE